MPDLEQLRRLSRPGDPSAVRGDHPCSTATRPSLRGQGGHHGRDRGRRWWSQAWSWCVDWIRREAGAGAPPIISPAPTPSAESRPRRTTTPQSLDSMTPKEVVTAAGAELEAVAVAPGDPDVRISMWHALCHWCPDRPDGRGGSLGPPTFTGMAITTDGYASASYARHPFFGRLGAVHSPRDDLFSWSPTSATAVSGWSTSTAPCVGWSGSRPSSADRSAAVVRVCPGRWQHHHLVLARPGRGDGLRLAGGVEPFGRAPSSGDEPGAGHRRAQGRSRTPVSSSRPGGTTTATDIVGCSPAMPGEEMSVGPRPATSPTGPGRSATTGSTSTRATTGEQPGPSRLVRRRGSTDGWR